MNPPASKWFVAPKPAATDSGHRGDEDDEEDDDDEEKEEAADDSDDAKAKRWREKKRATGGAFSWSSQPAPMRALRYQRSQGLRLSGPAQQNWK